MKILKIAILVATLAGCATEYVPLNSVSVNETKSYRDLSTKVRLDFPPHITSVGDAIEHVLEATDYQLLVYCTGCPQEAAKIAEDPISPLAFVYPLATTSAERAILLILGDDSRIVMDHGLRSISLEFMPENTVQRIVRPQGGFGAITGDRIVTLEELATPVEEIPVESENTAFLPRLKPEKESKITVEARNN